VPLTTSRKLPLEKYVLLALAVLLLLLGGVGIYVGSRNYPIRALGVVAVIASAYFVRTSRARDSASLPEGSRRGADIKTAEGSGRLLWIISLAMVPLLVVAFFLLHLDAVNGGHQAWPADVFAGVGVASAVAWGCLVAKILGDKAR
jgi:hypothetical protein